MTADTLNALADRLAEHNLWRRGLGKYAWNDGDPAAPMPFPPQKLGQDIDLAVKIIRKAAKEAAR